MEKRNMLDMTTGSVPKKLYRFAFPIIMTNLLQAVYSIADMIIVGRFAGPSSMAAVNIGSQITMVVFAIIMALANAEAALTGQLIGKKKMDSVQGLIHTVLSFTLILAAVIIVFILIFSGPLLSALNVPPEAYTETRRYLVIYICGTFFIYIYNDLYGLLRGAGESRAPMVIAVISTGVNIFLDYIMVKVCSLGAGGAAFATILSQMLSMILIIVFVRKRKMLFSFSVRELGFRAQWLKPLLKIGFPQVLQFSLTSFSFVLITALINRYGVNATAATGAVDKIYTIGALPGQAMMASMITFTAQNLPSKSYKRINQGIFYGAVLAFAIGAVCLLACELAPGALLGCFTTEAEVISIGIGYLRVYAFLFLVEGVMFCFYGALTGAGHTHITMACALVSAFLVRYLFAWLLGREFVLGFQGIAVAYILAPSSGLVIAALYYLTGKWKKTRVKI